MDLLLNLVTVDGIVQSYVNSYFMKFLLVSVCIQQELKTQLLTRTANLICYNVNSIINGAIELSNVLEEVENTLLTD